MKEYTSWIILKNNTIGYLQIDFFIYQEELRAKTGIDLKQEMAKKLKEMEVQWRKEKEEASEAFQQERKVWCSNYTKEMVSNFKMNLIRNFWSMIYYFSIRNMRSKSIHYRKRWWNKVWQCRCIARSLPMIFTVGPTKMYLVKYMW